MNTPGQIKVNYTPPSPHEEFNGSLAEAKRGPLHIDVVLN